jgi:hypothetical protein
MVVTVSGTRKGAKAEPSKQQRAADNMTVVQKVHRALASGQFKSELLTIQQALYAVRAFNIQATSLIARAGLDPEKDFSVALCYMTPDLTTLHTHPYQRGREAAIQAELSGPGNCIITVGVIFGIRDPEHKDNWLFGSRAFLDTPLVRMALKQRIEEPGGMT